MNSQNMKEEITLQEFSQRINLTIEEVVQLASKANIRIPVKPDLLVVTDTLMTKLSPYLENVERRETVVNPGDETDNVSAYAELNVGKVFDGKVVKVLSHGAYVDFDGRSGFIPLSEVAWGYVRDIHELLNEGQDIRVKVVGSKFTKILLSRRQLIKDPLADFVPYLEKGRELDGNRTQSFKRHCIY